MTNSLVATKGLFADLAELSAFGSRVAPMMLMLRHKATRASLSLGLRVARIRACRRARSVVPG
jgi:hypothetical protein